MRIQLLSDLHLERHPQFAPRFAPGADTLVLAGDIGSYQRTSRLTDPDFGLARFSPRSGEPRWDRVIFVPGNHEFDDLDCVEATVRLRDTCERLGILWLEREVLELGTVRFVGTTLWSDFDALAVHPAGGADGASPLTRQLRERQKAFRAANWYLSKNTTLRNGKPMLAEDIRELGLECQAWLRAALAAPFAGTTVVVTHFAPSLRSLDPRYGLSAGTAGFCNALDDLLCHADLWLHGHLHCPHDYVVKSSGHGCRVVANPMGYVARGEAEGFDPCLTIDVPARNAAR